MNAFPIRPILIATIALPPNSELRKPLHEQLLRYRESDTWDELVYRDLGE